MEQQQQHHAGAGPGPADNPNDPVFIGIYREFTSRRYPLPVPRALLETQFPNDPHMVEALCNVRLGSDAPAYGLHENAARHYTDGWDYQASTLTVPHQHQPHPPPSPPPEVEAEEEEGRGQGPAPAWGQPGGPPLPEVLIMTPVESTGSNSFSSDDGDDSMEFTLTTGSVADTQQHRQQPSDDDDDNNKSARCTNPSERPPQPDNDPDGSAMQQPIEDSAGDVEDDPDEGLGQQAAEPTPAVEDADDVPEQAVAGSTAASESEAEADNEADNEAENAAGLGIWQAAVPGYDDYQVPNRGPVQYTEEGFLQEPKLDIFSDPYSELFNGLAEPVFGLAQLVPEDLSAAVDGPGPEPAEPAGPGEPGELDAFDELDPFDEYGIFDAFGEFDLGEDEFPPWPAQSAPPSPYLPDDDDGQAITLEAPSIRDYAAAIVRQEYDRKAIIEYNRKPMAVMHGCTAFPFRLGHPAAWAPYFAAVQPSTGPVRPPRTHPGGDAQPPMPLVRCLRPTITPLALPMLDADRDHFFLPDFSAGAVSDAFMRPCDGHRLPPPPLYPPPSTEARSRRCEALSVAEHALAVGAYRQWSHLSTALHMIGGHIHRRRLETAAVGLVDMTRYLLEHVGVLDDSYVGAGLPVALKDKRRFWHRFLVATCYLLYEHSRRLAHLVLEHHTYASDSDSSSGSGSNRGSGGGHADHGIPGPLQPDDTPLTGQPYHAFTLRPEPWWLFGREVDADWKEFFEYAYWVEALVDDDNYSDCWTDSGRGRERPERPGRPANGGGSRWPSSVASSSTMHDSAGSQHGDEAPTPFTVPDEDGDSDGDDDSNDVEMPDKPGSGSSGGGRDDGCSDYDRSSSSSDDGDDGDDDDGTRDVIHRTATEANVVSVSTLRCLHEALTELRHVLRADGASSDAPDADRHLLHESFCYFMELFDYCFYGYRALGWGPSRGPPSHIAIRNGNIAYPQTVQRPLELYSSIF